MARSEKSRLLALLGTVEKADAYLRKAHGMPLVPRPRGEVQEDSVRDAKGRQVPLGECGESATLQTDQLASLYREAGADESIRLSVAWERYVECMDVIADALLPADQRAAFHQLALEDARSRYREAPTEIPESLGTAADFRRRWQNGELDIIPRRDGRDFAIEVWVHAIPPDEEDRDVPGWEPPGHWDRLVRQACETEGS